MKKTTLFGFIIIMVFSFLSSNDLYSQWREDSEYNFKINVPNDWQSKSYTDGTDKVYDFVNPDENIVIEVRAFVVDPTVTADMLAKVFEESAIAGGQKLAYEDYELNGNKGKFGAYKNIYDGIEVGMGVFYAIKNGNGYIVWSMIATSVFDKYSAQADAVLNSFTITGKSDPQITIVKPVEITITKVIMGDKMQGKDKITSQTTRFYPDSENMYAVFEWEGNGNGKQLNIKWVFKDQNVLIDEVTYNMPDQNGGVSNSSLSKPYEDWPVGTYLIEFWMDGEQQKSVPFKVVEKQSTIGGGLIGTTTISSGNIKTVTIGGRDSYNFKLGKVTNNHDDDVLNEPWCTKQPGICGNWVLTGKSNMKDVTSPPASGYISDKAGYVDCQPMPLNNVAVFKLKDGTYAKFMIIKDNFTKDNSQQMPCQHELTVLIEYPAF